MSSLWSSAYKEMGNEFIITKHLKVTFPQKIKPCIKYPAVV